jgi:uncharacterized protein (DUF4415 family)
MSVRERKLGSAKAAKSGSQRVRVTLPLDQEVIDHFRQQGRDWQKRMNEALSRAIEREKKRTTA